MAVPIRSRSKTCFVKRVPRCFLLLHLIRAKKYKFQPDLLQVFPEHLGGKQHPSTGVRASKGKRMAGISNAVWC